MEEYMHAIYEFIASQSVLELIGLVAGLLAVYLLIQENILTWPAGLVYVVVSLPVFLEAKLYQDFVLHIFFFGMNVYGWVRWAKGRRTDEAPLHIVRMNSKEYLITLLVSVVGIGLSGYLFDTYTDAELVYGDATTTILSFVAMWLTAEKKLENWVLWLIVDVVAATLYYIKGIYPYFILYLIYCGMALAGLLNWLRLYKRQQLAQA